MTIKSSVLVGPTHVMALGHPFVGTPAPRTPEGELITGVPIGIDMRTHEVVYFDPWQLKRYGIIHSAFGIFLGPKGYGKSTEMKVIADRLMLLSAGFQFMRVAINDYKPEGKASEYAEFSKVHLSVVFAIAGARVNPFDPRLYVDQEDPTKVYEFGMFDMARTLGEFDKRSQLDADETDALRVALRSMIQKNREMWLPGTLEKEARTLTIDQVVAYFRQIDQNLLDQYQIRLDNLRTAGATEELIDEVTAEMNSLLGKTDNVDPASIQAAGERVAGYLRSINQGTYGNMVGDSNSLYDMLTQWVVTMDWRNVTPEGESLMRTLLTKLKVTMIESNRLDLLAHIEIDDERHKSMDNPVYAKTSSYFSEIGRATHMCNLSATHRYNSLRKGGVGSELWMTADTIIKNTGFTFIGRQENDPAVLSEIQALHQISDADTRLLPHLPKYCFGLKLGEEQHIRFIRTFVTPEEMVYLKTDIATDRMTDRPMLASVTDLRRFATENGISYVGFPDAA